MVSTQSFSLIVSDFISLFFPNYCCSCDLTLTKSEEFICTHCRAEINLSNIHKDQPNILHQRFFEIPNLQYAITYAWFKKDGVIQQLLHQLKYEGDESIGTFLGEIYGKELRDFEYQDKWDYITSVPLHYKKFRKRGFNQSDKIAEGLSLSMDLQFVRLLKKEVNRSSQTKKHRLDRFTNVEESFGLLNSKVSVEGKRILVVDDVLTTGATIQAACQPLVKAGAKVSILTIAAVK